MKRSDQPFAELACAALRGEAPVWPFGSAAGQASAFVEYCGYHGVSALVVDAMQGRSAWTTWHGAVRERLQHDYRGMAALELLRQRESQRMLEEFALTGIDTLLLKGTALAYGLYPEPALRTRTDTDLLIGPADKARAFDLLRDLGYRMPNAITGRYVSTQQTFLKEQQGVTHAVDLHWQISNAHVFARQFPFAELWEAALPVTALGTAAYMLSLPHALLHACLHRAVHIRRGEGDRLQWYYDIHLLSARLGDRGWQSFAALAHDKGLRMVCADALQGCRQQLGTRLPEQVMTTLAAPGSRHELSAALLAGSWLKSELTNYRALPSWRARWALLREQLLPDARYMQQRYGAYGIGSLARAYLLRLLRAPAKLLGTADRRVSKELKEHGN